MFTLAGSVVAVGDDMRAINEKVIADFRARRRGPGPAAAAAHHDRRPDRAIPHTTPMMFVPDGDRLLVIASNAGAPRHPDWYRNLVAHPDVTVEVTGETYAGPGRGHHRRRAGPAVGRPSRGQYPFFLDHQAKVAPDHPGGRPRPALTGASAAPR